MVNNEKVDWATLIFEPNYKIIRRYVPENPKHQEVTLAWVGCGKVAYVVVIDRRDKSHMPAMMAVVREFEILEAATNSYEYQLTQAGPSTFVLEIDDDGKTREVLIERGNTWTPDADLGDQEHKDHGSW